MLEWLLPSTFRGNYNFYVEVQPKTIESNSNITLTCYSNKDKGAVLPTAINWFRLRNGMVTNLSHVRGNTYMCDPSDVGATIRAEIRVPAAQLSVELRLGIDGYGSSWSRTRAYWPSHEEEHLNYLIHRGRQLYGVHGGAYSRPIGKSTHQRWSYEN